MAKMLSIAPETATEPTTIQAAIEEFLDRNWSRHTKRNYRSDLTRFAQNFGSRSVQELRGVEIQAYLDGLQKRSGGGVAPSTFNRHYSSIQSLFTWLVKQEDIDRSPMDRVERQRQQERLPRPMTEEQLEVFFSRIKELRDRALFSLLYGSGIRVSEALGLDIEQLNLADGTFTLMGKGDVERVGYLSEESTKLIRRYLRERGRPKHGPLFESRLGRLSYAMTHHLFRKYAQGIPGERPTIHALRHSFGSERAGHIDALILRDLMGHKSLRTTQRYAKVNPVAAHQAFRAFDRHRNLRK